ncbi:MAG: ATP-binding cassette domain-containing protein [Wolbachia endosymbiont of Alcedoecus sp.]|nr:ATP-binding cassette domain-containing protein [Wolbachia endosymbiont of Alcedoecus sp.]
MIESGQKVGLVGYSGGGKSTFVNLVLRLYDVKSGKISIDGQDIRNVTQDSLHRNIGMIPQDPSLFHRTLMENIRYGKADASDDEVIETAKRAHAHEFISKLPQGYESLVGERGVKLSGGQRQRIAIARAILKNAPILILDEATSQLNSVTESDIQKSLWELMQGKTTIVIAHRLSTLLHMDRILVFDKGKRLSKTARTKHCSIKVECIRLYEIHKLGDFCQRKVEWCASRGSLKSKRKVFF